MQLDLNELFADCSAMEQLAQQLAAWQASPPAAAEFVHLERRLHELVQAVECALLASQAARYDAVAPEVVVQGQRYRRVLRSPQTYQSLAGPLHLERHLYRPEEGAGKTICPLELRLGLLAGLWTPGAAEAASLAVSEMPPEEAAALLPKVGGMQPSRASLERLPKLIGAEWETSREEWEATLQTAAIVPPDAVTMAVSLDGVQVPMRSPGAAKAGAKGKARTQGPVGYKEASCGTISFYNTTGVRLGTWRCARPPEARKKELKAHLAATAEAFLAQRPDLHLVLLSDGAPDHWTFLERWAGERPHTSLADFWHAAEYLKGALDDYYGERSPKASSSFAAYKTLLQEDAQGADKVIQTLRYRAGRCRGEQRKRIRQALRYFRKQRSRMGYAAARGAGWPIGSGVTEAACKTLVTQRCKQSGMRWSAPGLEAILMLRSWWQSDQWEPAWELLHAARTQVVMEVWD